MKLVVLERNTVGTDIDVSSFEQFGEVTYYKNTVKDEVKAHVGDAEIVIANKAPINEETIGDCPNVKMVCEFATGYDNVDLDYCRKRKSARKHLPRGYYCLSYNGRLSLLYGV